MAFVNVSFNETWIILPLLQMLQIRKEPWPSLPKLQFAIWDNKNGFLALVPQMIDYQFGFGHKPFIDANCPVTDCLTTSNKSLLGMLKV